MLVNVTIIMMSHGRYSLVSTSNVRGDSVDTRLSASDDYNGQIQDKSSVSANRRGGDNVAIGMGPMALRPGVNGNGRTHIVPPTPATSSRGGKSSHHQSSSRGKKGSHLTISDY